MRKNSDTGSLEKKSRQEQPKRMEYIQCSACKAVYSVKVDMFGENGRYVRCIVCGKLWLQLPQDVKLLEENMETRELSEEVWEQWKLGSVDNE
ncbi:29 kDa ribonucleoprotein B, chloroplastic [Galdieria sulphuraria]|nr:29 kDa ribonucleoprotein B, chloroplastic [Galdieria sulphuraria]